MSWILTRSGHRLDLLQPNPACIHPGDISQALSCIARFNGHTRHHYSVAQHSLLVASIVPPEHQLVALLHDATEAYIGDMVRPLKALLPGYCEIEHELWLAICERFGIAPELPDCIYEADMIALATEREQLMPWHGDEWECLHGITPLPEALECWTPPQAQVHYLNRLLELMQTHHRSTWQRVDAAHAGGPAPQCM